MKKILPLLLVILIITSCKKEYQVASDQHEHYDLVWSKVNGINNSDHIYRFAFVKNNELYIYGSQSYVVLNAQHKLSRTINFSTPLTETTYSGRHNNDFLLVAGYQELILKHLGTGIEKRLETPYGYFTYYDGFARIMLSKYNNLYFNTNRFSKTDSTNFGLHLRLSNNQIMLDTIARLTMNDLHGSGNRYQTFIGPQPNNESFIYDDKLKTYTNFEKAYSGYDPPPPFLPIQEINDTAIIVTHNEYGGDTVKVFKFIDNQFIETRSITDKAGSIDWVYQYHLYRNKLYFEGSDNGRASYNIGVFDLGSGEMKQLRSNINLGSNFKIIDFNNKLYIISPEGIFHTDIEG